jgi:hypothetical protein
MSNLNSQFQLMAGRPPHGASAMEGNFLQKTSESPVLTEGMIGKIENVAGNARMSKLTGGTTGATPDYPWLVIEGADMSDSQFTGLAANPRLTVLAVKTGLIFKVDTAVSLVVGDLVWANAGVIAKVSTTKQAIGQVIGVNSSAQWAVIAC